MAYKAYKIDKDIWVYDAKGNKRYRADFVLDTEDDVAAWEKATEEHPAGTTGTVVSTGTTYMLGTNKNWGEM